MRLLYNSDSATAFLVLVMEHMNALCQLIMLSQLKPFLLPSKSNLSVVGQDLQLGAPGHRCATAVYLQVIVATAVPAVYLGAAPSPCTQENASPLPHPKLFCLAQDVLWVHKVMHL